LAPNQPIEKIKQFMRDNLEVWVSEGKDGSLHGLIRYAMQNTFPKWLTSQTKMERNLQAAQDVVTNYDPDDEWDSARPGAALPPVYNEEDLL
jgi:hypothetical protein